jgi:DNA polymerase-3 subunit epsilon
MEACRDLLKLPPSPRMLAVGDTWYKAPSLSECYRHFTGEERVVNHDAMEDALSCRTVFFAMRKSLLLPSPKNIES